MDYNPFLHWISQAVASFQPFQPPPAEFSRRPWDPVELRPGAGAGRCQKRFWRVWVVVLVPLAGALWRMEMEMEFFLTKM